MPDETLSPDEVFAALDRLFSAQSWEQRFQILEQEQATLLNPLTGQILLTIIKQGKQENARPEELDILTIHYRLLQRIQEIGLPAAWEEFIDALIDDETRELVGAAFDKLLNAATFQDMQHVFEQERSLFLSEGAALLWQSAFAHTLQAEDVAKENGLAFLHLLKSILDLMHAGQDEAAWGLLQDHNKQHYERLMEALDALLQAPDRETTRLILEEKQEYLLTDHTDQILSSRIEQEEVASSDSTRELRLQGLLRIRDLLRNARSLGIPQAILQVPEVRPLTEGELGTLLDKWLATNTIRAKRRFLEAHLEILQPLSETLLQEGVDRLAEKDTKIASIARPHLRILHDILARGQTIQAIRDAYVEQTHGFALDIPSWHEAVEGQLKELSRQEADGAAQIKLLREAIAYARQDTEVAPEVVAELQNRLGVVLRDTPMTDPSYAPSMEEALSAFHTAMQTFEPARYPYQYARLQYRMGRVYSQRPGDRSENLEKAIACYKTALCGYTFDRYPRQWAATQGYLGRAYRDRIVGDKQANQEQALACFDALLRVYTREVSPGKWITAQIDLSRLYTELVAGERRNNLERALAYAEAALQAADYATLPEDWARAQLMLGSVYAERILGERCDNLERAIACYEAVLSIESKERSFLEWAKLQSELGDLYRQRIAGKRHQNLEKALACQQAALEICSREAFPVQWATIQVNLSAVYIERLEGGRPNNMEQAIVSLHEALQILAKETHPTEWALAQTFLAVATASRIAGSRRENQEAAIAYCNAALTVFTREYDPVRWAMLQNTLAEIYYKRLAGTREENLELAVHYCQNALLVRTRDDFPGDWAITQATLGNVYTYSGYNAGERQRLLEQALEHYQYALHILTEETFPAYWAVIQAGLSAAYVWRIDGRKSENLQQAISRGQSALRLLTRVSYPFEWAAVHATLGEAYRQATLYADLQELYSGRAVMQEQAIRHLEAALQVCTQHEYPLEWAGTQRFLGLVYLDRVRDKRYENLTRARACVEAALQVFSREYAPADWAGCQILLGLVSLYAQNERKMGIEQAIAYFEQALIIYHPETYPILWAITQANLSSAYTERIEGDQQENIERAIQHGQAACTILSRQNAPLDWAEAQTNLSLAYLKRTAGERRVNIEQAIDHCGQALLIFSKGYAPFRWARVQLHLSAAYSERLEGKREQNQWAAVLHAEQALEVYTEENAPEEWARLQVRIGMARASLERGARDNHAALAEAHYKEALRVFTPESYPLYMAHTQMLLGLLYHSLGVNAAEYTAYKKRAIACYQAALTVVTRETHPLLWAIVQYALGACYAFFPADQEAEIDLSIELIKQSLAIVTPDSFPYEHHNNLQALLLIELGRQNWQAVLQTARAIYQAEKRLLETSSDIRGFDVILAKSISPLTFGAFALLQQGEIEQAAIMLERGRAQSLAQAMALHEAAPERIQNVELRARYSEARRSLQQARAALAQMTSLSNLATQQARQTFLEHTAACEDASHIFDAVIAEIRLARDPANFLDDTVSRETLQQALTTKDPDHALVYVAALPDINDFKVGGFALSVLPAGVTANDREALPLRFASCELPALTYEFVLDLLHRGTLEDAPSLGGLMHAQILDLQALEHKLATGFTGEHTLRDTLTEIVKGTQTNTLLASLAACLHDPALAHILDKPYAILQKEELKLLSSKWAFAFLQAELHYCQQRLAPVLLRPLYDWLRTLEISSLTLIPCGRLAALPLTTLLLDGERTLGDLLSTSVAPSARSLSQPPVSHTARAGIRTFGNPQVDLPWGELEASTLATIARQLHIESRSAIQGAVTREAVFRSLECAEVVDLSCHGQVKRDDYLQSALLLARKPMSREKPQLTLADLLNREQEVRGLRLLILSSCQSAIPDQHGATEEVRSLTSAMLQAGACAVLAPLWSIHDKATYLLMVRFAQEWFPHLRDEPPAAALARAQYWLRTVSNSELQHWEAGARLLSEQKERSAVPLEMSLPYEVEEAQKQIRKDAELGNPLARPYADPIYWAGFQIVGW